MKETYSKPVLLDFGKLMDVTYGGQAGSFCDNTGSGYWTYSG